MFTYREKIKVLEQVIEELESRNAWKTVAKLKEVVEDLQRLEDLESQDFLNANEN